MLLVNTFCPQQCAIRLPAEYLDSLKEYREALTQIRAQVASAMAVAGPGSGPGTGAGAGASAAGAGAGNGAEEKKRKQVVASAAVSRKFMVS